MRGILLGLAVMVLAGVARGDVVFDNLSPTNTASGSTFGAHTSYAQKFSSGNGGAISTIKLNLFNNTTFSGAISVQIYSVVTTGSDTGKPNTLAFDFFLGDQNNLGTLGGGPISITGNISGFNTALQAGTDYFLVVNRGASATNGGSLDWGAGDSSQGGAGKTYSAATLGGAWTEVTSFPQGFGAEIVTVPEPGTLLLGGIAAACGGGGVWWRRKRKPQVAEAVETVTAV